MAGTDLLVVEASRRGKLAVAGVALGGLTLSAYAEGLTAVLVTAVVLLVIVCIELTRESVELIRQVRGSQDELGLLTTTADHSNQRLVASQSAQRQAEEERDLVKLKLGTSARTLEEVRLVVTQARGAAEQAVADRARAASEETRRPVLGLTLASSGDVEVLVASMPPSETGVVALVGPDGVLVSEMLMTASANGQGSAKCLMGDLPPGTASDLTTFGQVAPAGLFVELAGAVAEVFSGVRDTDLSDLARGLAETGDALELSIRNRSTL